MSLNERFSDNNELVADAQFLHPSCFQEELKNSISKYGLKKLVELPCVDHSKLVEELFVFSKIYKDLVGNVCQRTKNVYSTEFELSKIVSDEETDFVSVEEIDDSNVITKKSKNIAGKQNILIIQRPKI